ncbi:hypothetical protein GC209_11285 [bacterium]|nr:hypothetical protein [bacterium]
MFAWLLSAAETLALALQRIVPPGLRGLDVLTPDTLARVQPGRAVRLVLPESGLLQQRLDLPAAEARPSPTWLAARIEALSPWETQACLWDARAGGRVLDLAVIPLRPVQEAEAALTAQGARLAEVVAGPYRFRADTVQLRRWRDRVALIFGLVLLVALGLAGLGGEMSLQAQDRAATAEAALQRSIARLKEGAGPAQAALGLLPRKTASLTGALSHLAAALPQDSFLTTLSVTPEGFEISGRTQRPDGIIPALSADPLFAQVDFAGPAARDPDSGSYTFTIRGKLVAP